MDVRMPKMGGLEALKILKETAPDIGVVMLTTFDEEEQLVTAIRSGARGYLLKDVDRETLFRSVRAVARGEALLDSQDLETVLAGEVQARGDESTLTQREDEVLRALVEGASNKSIARSLDISERTVKAHLTSIYEKLGVQSRTEAVARALQDDLL